MPVQSLANQFNAAGLGVMSQQKMYSPHMQPQNWCMPMGQIQNMYGNSGMKHPHNYHYLVEHKFYEKFDNDIFDEVNHI